MEYRVEGPVMIMLTTTAIDIDEELLNRCLVLTVDEDREQTRAIHKLQRERRTLAGLVHKSEKRAVLDLHKNAQRLLRPLAVVNPYADRLTFTDDKTRTRRDHNKYLALIDAIALLHQHQRVTKRIEHGDQVLEYVEVTTDDIALANRLCAEVLGRTLDELPPQTRKLLGKIDALVTKLVAEKSVRRSDVRLTRRVLLDATGLSYTQLAVHMQRLADVEHVLVHAGSRGHNFVYELLYDGQGKDGRPFLAGLIDVDTLKPTATTSASRGSEGRITGASRPHLGPISGASRSAEIVQMPRPDAPPSTSSAVPTKNAGRVADAETSYRNGRAAP